MRGEGVQGVPQPRDRGVVARFRCRHSFLRGQHHYGLGSGWEAAPAILHCALDSSRVPEDSGARLGQKIHHRALSLFHSPICAGGAFISDSFSCYSEVSYVCTNVCHSEDEVLLFGKHFGLLMNNDVLPYLAPFVLDAYVGWRGLVSSRHIRVPGEVVLQSKRCLWTATSSCPSCP